MILDCFKNAQITRTFLRYSKSISDLFQGWRHVFFFFKSRDEEGLVGLFKYCVIIGLRVVYVIIGLRVF